MKKIRYSFLCIIFILVGVCTCLHSQGENKEDEKIYSITEEEEMSFEELIDCSNVALVGEYQKIHINEDKGYVEYEFKVKECIFGEIEDEIIYVFMTSGTHHVQELDYEYKGEEILYESGKEYILILEKYESIMYDHDRYLQNSDLILCESDSEYSLYSESLQFSKSTDIKDSILALKGPEMESAKTENNITYKTETEKIIGESENVGLVEIQELYIEGVMHNGNTYKCKVNELYKGKNLNTLEDGTILIVILKDTVQVGQEYIIGFTAVDENSIIYTQTTVPGVLASTSENIMYMQNNN